MKIAAVLSVIAAAVLFFFGLMYVLASSLDPDPAPRFAVGMVLFVVAFALVYVAYIVSRKPQTIIHQVEVSGQMKAAPLRCPNCSASVDASTIRILSGVPYAKCTYCGHTFEVTEEPKW
jgi:predicted Zn finger-like uncharacterized protein